MTQVTGKAGLKVQILVPMALLLAIVITAFVYGTVTVTEEQEHAAQDVQKTFASAQRFYHSALELEAEKLSVALDFLLRNDTLRRALAEKNRKGLLQHAAPIFRQLRKKYHITHFYFLGPRRDVILRVHQPQRYGDTINRFTALAAEKTGKPAHGVELGPLGTFTLRTVFPWRYKGQLLGYVELGEEIEEIMDRVRQTADADLYVAISKRLLVRKDWAEGMRMLGRHPNWNQLPSSVITYQPRGPVPVKALGALMGGAGETKEVTFGGRDYRALGMPLQDAGGRGVGRLVVVRDMTERLVGNRRAVLSLALFSTVLGVALLSFFYLLTSRVERRLEGSRRKIIDEAKKREALQARHIRELEQEHACLQEAQSALLAKEITLANAQRIAHLGSWEWDVASGNAHWSDEVYRIFGLSPGQFEPTYDSFLQQVHPDDRAMVKEAMSLALHEGKPCRADYRLVRPDGSERIVHEEAEVTFGRNGTAIRMTGTVQDITERRKAEARLDYLAYYDDLTGLPNRLLLRDHLSQALIEAKRHSRLVGVMLLDVDRFKVVNDTMGHEAGNALLQGVAARLRACVREGDTVARLGGDEFALILAGLAQADDSARIAQKILDRFGAPFPISDSEFFGTVSIGITLYPTDNQDIEGLLKNADSAMYYAKEQGRNNYQFYAPEMTARAQQRFALKNQLRYALERGELQLHYQPQLDLGSNRIVGLEALLRWRHPKLGAISPATFIPLAEETGLIVPLGEWVLRSACEQLKSWRQEGLPAIKLAVNLSSRQFKKGDLAEVVSQLLRATGVAPQHLELEITESVLMEDSGSVSAILAELKTQGVTISIDDFGTGYSSLSYLKRFPIDTLKIDRSFVRDISSDADDAAIVKAIIAMAHSLRLWVIAEGVETEQQLEFLRAEGCDAIQGFYLARPMPAEECFRFMRERE